MLTDPVFALNTGSKALHQVEWSPTRPGVLATLSKDELGLKLWVWPLGLDEAWLGAHVCDCRT